MLTDAQREIFYAFGYSCYLSGKLEKAIETFEVLTARQPLEKRNWVGLAASLQEAKQYEPALHAWAMAALVDGEDPYPHFHAAQCYFSLNDLEQAKFAIESVENRIGKDHPLQETLLIWKEQWRI